MGINIIATLQNWKHHVLHPSLQPCWLWMSAKVAQPAHVLYGSQRALEAAHAAMLRGARPESDVTGFCLPPDDDPTQLISSRGRRNAQLVLETGACDHWQFLRTL